MARLHVSHLFFRLSPDFPTSMLSEKGVRMSFAAICGNPRESALACTFSRGALGGAADSRAQTYLASSIRANARGIVERCKSRGTAIDIQLWADRSKPDEGSIARGIAIIEHGGGRTGRGVGGSRHVREKSRSHVIDRRYTRARGAL